MRYLLKWFYRLFSVDTGYLPYVEKQDYADEIDYHTFKAGKPRRAKPHRL